MQDLRVLIFLFLAFLPYYTCQESNILQFIYTVKNDCGFPVSFSYIGTIFEGFESNYVKLALDGEKLRYGGVLRKRIFRPPFEYRILMAEESISQVFSINFNYFLPRAGNYSLTVTPQEFFLQEISPDSCSLKGSLTIYSPDLQKGLDPNQLPVIYENTPGIRYASLERSNTLDFSLDEEQIKMLAEEAERFPLDFIIPDL